MCRSAVVWRLGSRVRILLKACLSVSCVPCVVWVAAFATGWSLVRRSPTGCGVSVCDLKTSLMRWPGPELGCYVTEKKNLILIRNWPHSLFHDGWRRLKRAKTLRILLRCEDDSWQIIVRFTRMMMIRVCKTHTHTHTHNLLNPDRFYTKFAWISK
jgi:hypothetical protein